MPGIVTIHVQLVIAYMYTKMYMYVVFCRVLLWNCVLKYLIADKRKQKDKSLDVISGPEIGALCCECHII